MLFRSTSPTYTIGHRYKGRLTVSHLDLYRFKSVSPAEWGDLEPYFSDAVVFVEWPEAGAGAFPPPRAKVSIEHDNGTRRRITVDSSDATLLTGLDRAHARP